MIYAMDLNDQCKLVYIYSVFELLYLDNNTIMSV